MKMIIMSGISGSGKSTKAKEIQQHYLNQNKTANIYSSDEFFYENGEYKFNPNLLPVYHQKNKDRVYEACRDNIDVVIVDNTNLILNHVKPYILIAKIFDYELEFHRINSNLEESKRNLHNVPDYVRQNMLDIMQDINVFIEYANKIT